MIPVEAIQQVIEQFESEARNAGARADYTNNSSKSAMYTGIMIGHVDAANTLRGVIAQYAPEAQVRSQESDRNG